MATDISESALERARSGLYIENIELDVAPDRLRRFFVRVNSHYQIIKSVRDLCVFSRHNLIRDPPFARLDLISCRNVLIYLGPALQRRVIPIFHYALRPDGVLLLGTSETTGAFTDLFDLVHDRYKFYSKKPVPTPIPVEFELAGNDRHPELTGAERAVRSPLDLQREADRIVLGKFGPPGIVVDEHFNILQFRGNTGPYLAPAPGQASLNLLKMVREGLQLELRKALEQAKAENVTRRKENLLIKEADGFRTVNLEVIPFKLASDRRILVLFEDVQTSSPAAGNAGSQATSDREQRAPEAGAAQLQQELDGTREYLQTVIEENETTTEELRSAHEEILSNNEELQSTNEELQIAKEEMQSANEELATVNEELATVNEELHHRNQELGKVNDDLVNLFGGVNIPIVMVDRDLRIRRMTPLAEKLFNLIATDIGRSIAHIRPNLDIPEFERLIADVIHTVGVRELKARDREGRWYAVRIQPYKSQDNKVDGASIVALDIDGLRSTPEQPV
jgi:two-component system CheB/CheR fusion protein